MHEANGLGSNINHFPMTFFFDKVVGRNSSFLENFSYKKCFKTMRLKPIEKKQICFKKSTQKICDK